VTKRGPFRDARLPLLARPIPFAPPSCPHAHIVIRGVDRDGQELRLDRAYISRGLRWRTQERAAPRARRAPHVLSRNRTGALHFALSRPRAARQGRPRRGPLQRPTGTHRRIHARRPPPAPRRTPARRASVPHVVETERGWQHHLRELGSRGDILKHIHTAISGDPARYRIVRPGQALAADPTGGSDVVSGRVASKGLSDELRWLF